MSRRLWLGTAVAVGSAVWITVGLTAVAGATTHMRVKPTPVTCSGISGTDDIGTTLTLSGCTGPTGGSGTVAGPFFTPSVVHWAAGGSTTVTFDGNVHIGHTCPNGNQSVVLHHGVVASSSVAGISGKFKVTFCFDSSGNMSLKPRTLMRF